MMLSPSDEAAAISGIVGVVNKHSRASAMTDSSAVPLQQRQLADVTARVMNERWDQILEAAELYNHAVLQVYMSDGWSCDMSDSVTVRRLHGKKCFRREKRERTEWLLERQVLRSLDAAGQHELTIRCTMPKMLAGKRGCTSGRQPLLHSTCCDGASGAASFEIL